MYKTLIKSLTVILVAAWGLSCARDVGTVDRTQPNKVEKRVFQDPGPWYYRQTVIDVPYSTGFTFVGFQDDTFKVVWDIQEKYLIAYRAEEWLDQGETYATRPGTLYKGAPVAAYAIESHFDVIRDYNPATGEQTNVLVENTTDKPWYERAYMRVDWSQNLLPTFMFFAQEWDLDPISFRSIAYYVSEGDGDKNDLPIIKDDYVDIVQKVFAEPEGISFYGYGKIPLCWLYGFSNRDCLGQAIKLRASFKKVPSYAQNDYEPLQYDDKDFQKFGYFRSERFSYDRRRDMVESARIYNINRWNMWTRSHNDAACDVDGDCGTGSRCDLYWPRANRRGTCTLPFEQRGVRTTPWWVNQQMPSFLRDENERLLQAWDDHFRETVANLQNRPLAQIPRVFVLCNWNDQGTGPHPNNPAACVVHDRDPETGEITRMPQIGDLRYNFLYWVAHPQEYSPLGYGPSAADPITGEIFSANAFFYGSAAETYASYAQDIVNLLNEDLDLVDLIDGENIRQWIESQRDNHRPPAFLHQHADDPQALRAAVGQHIHGQKEVMQRRVIKDRLPQKVSRLKERIASGQAYHDYAAANMNTLKGSWSLPYMVNDEIARAFGPATYDPTVPLTPEQLAEVDPTTWAHPAIFKAENARLEMMARRRIEMAEFFDESILWRATNYKNTLVADFIAEHGQQAWDQLSAPQQAELYQELLYRGLLEDIYYGAEIHEVGHTVGLRHNFAGSADALNYMDGYWDIRAAEDMLYPEYVYQYILPEYYLNTEFYVANTNIRELQNSSIMDYGAKFNSDFGGLGRYDRAAILYGYGKLVEVFDPPASVLPSGIPPGARERLKPGNYHYTMIPLLLTNRIEPNPTTGQWPTPYWENYFKDLIGARRVVPASELPGEGQPYDGFRVEVPYLFCSDEYAGGSGYCFRFDQGADNYERMINTIDYYQNYYFFNNFRRERVGWGEAYWPYLSRIMGRYFDVVSSLYKHFVNDEFIIRGNTMCPDVGAGGQIESIDHYISAACGYDGLFSAYSALDFWWKVLQTPTVGTYRKILPDDSLDDMYTEYPVYEYIDRMDLPLQPGELSYELPLGPGKYGETVYDREDGYYFYNKPRIMGAWWDKYLAMLAMGDPYTNFIGVDVSSDTRSFLINFNNLFGEQIANFMGAMMIEDFDRYAPVVGLLPADCSVDGQQFGVIYRHLQRYMIDPDPYRLRDVVTNAVVLNPDEQYTVRVIAGYLGSAYFSQDVDDQDYNEAMKIWLKGQGEQIELPPGAVSYDEHARCVAESGVPSACRQADYIELTDPVSNRTYVAQRRKGIAPYMCVVDEGLPTNPCDQVTTYCHLDGTTLTRAEIEAGLFDYVDDPESYPIGFRALQMIRERFYDWSPTASAARLEGTLITGGLVSLTTTGNGNYDLYLVVDGVHLPVDLEGALDLTDVADAINALAMQPAYLGTDVARVQANRLVIESPSTGPTSSVRLVASPCASQLFSVLATNLPIEVAGQAEGWVLKPGIYASSVHWEVHFLNVLRGFLHNWEYNRF